VAVVVCEDRAKDKGVIPVRIPRKAVVRTGEGDAELAGGVKWVVEARPGKEKRIRPPRAEKV
jgi:hypothetical protein